MSIFLDMVEDTIEVFMDDFSVVCDSFEHYLSHLVEVLKRCESFLKAFGELKDKFVSAPIIIFPYWSKTFEVMYDTSGVALGVVLGKIRDKMLHPLC